MKKKTRRIILGIIAAAVIICGAFWAKNYYNDRYVVYDSFYTQIPEDEVNEDSWLLDMDGVQQEKGKRYTLIGYNEAGEQREVSFTKKGTAEDYYAPGTYIKVNTSKTIVLEIEIIEKSDVPKAALEQIALQGTRK